MKASGIPILFILVTLTAISPLLLNEFLPLVDIPNHIARHYIAVQGGTVPALAQYYDYAFGIAPNSAVDLILHLSGYSGDLYVFARIMMAIYMVNFIASTLVLSRVVQGRWSYWPLASGLLVYNGPFFWGFENYLFSIPFAIYGLALWLALASRKLWLRVGVFVVYCGLLYLMHFFAFALLAVAVFGSEVQKLIEQKQTPKLAYLARNLPLALPFVLPVAVLLIGIVAGEPNAAGTQNGFGGLGSRLHVLLSISLGPDKGTVPGLNASGLVLIVFFLVVFLHLLRREGYRLEFSQSLKGPVIAVFVISLFAPFWLNGVAFVNIRYPFVLVALLIAATRWRDLKRVPMLILVMIVAALLVVRAHNLNRMSAIHSTEVSQLILVLQDVPAGSRVLPLGATGQTGRMRRQYAQAYAVAERNAFVPSLFQGVHSLAVRDEWKPYAHPIWPSVDYNLVLFPERLAEDLSANRRESMSKAYYQNWREKFHYVLMLDPIDEDFSQDARLRLVRQAGFFKLFEVN